MKNLRLLHNGLSGLLILLLLVLSSEVVAKPKLPEPNGIQVGNVVLHPGAFVDLAFDSNRNQGSSEVANDHKPVMDGYVNTGASFRTRLHDESHYEWNLSTKFAWKQYFGAGDASADGGFITNVRTDANLFKQSLVRVAPRFSYQYVDQPEDDNLRKDFKYHNTLVGAAVYIQPSEGKVFSQKIAYDFQGFLYPEHGDLTFFSHRFELLSRWNFLPQSSINLLIDQRIVHYLHDNRDSIEQGIRKNLTSTPFRVQAGIQSLFFSRLHIALGLGYAYTLYKEDPNEHMFIMQATLRYVLTENMDLELGYKKDFENSTRGSYYKYHRINLSYHTFLLNHLSTELSFITSIIENKGETIQNKEDILMGATAAAFWHFIPGLKLGVEYRMRTNLTPTNSYSYNRHVVGLKFSYEY